MKDLLSKSGTVLTISFVSLLALGNGIAHAKSIADEVKARGVIRIGSSYDAPPMGYVNDQGKWTGFDVDLGNALAKHLGVKVKRVKVNDTTRIAFLATGRVDVTLAHMSHTRSRDEQVDFAQPAYLWTCKIFYARKGRFHSLKQLGGKRIGVVQGSNAYTAAPKELAKFSGKKPKMMSFQKNADVFAALRDGRIDAYTQDTPIIAAVAGHAGVDFAPVGKCYSPGLYGIGVPPNDSKWRDEVSFALQDMLRDGTYNRIYAKWFGKHGKFPLAVNAKPRLPMSAFGRMAFIWPN
ncbi:MAG TPA: transporter substrate-binding domain-containing protein [Gammaproteobacteria bacterium]|nr:transporter substrate-binding domain-containing protein [Gammaproteobacteria bacterium]